MKLIGVKIGSFKKSHLEKMAKSNLRREVDGEEEEEDGGIENPR